MADLEQKYKDKPDQLESVIKLGNRLYRSTRQVWQYEDILYESSREGCLDQCTCCLYTPSKGLKH